MYVSLIYSKLKSVFVYAWALWFWRPLVYHAPLCRLIDLFRFFFLDRIFQASGQCPLRWSVGHYIRGPVSICTWFSLVFRCILASLEGVSVRPFTPSVHPSVGPSICWSVRPKFGPSAKHCGRNGISGIVSLNHFLPSHFFSEGANPNIRDHGGKRAKQYLKNSTVQFLFNGQSSGHITAAAQGFAQRKHSFIGGGGLGLHTGLSSPTGSISSPTKQMISSPISMPFHAAGLSASFSPLAPVAEAGGPSSLAKTTQITYV